MANALTPRAIALTRDHSSGLTAHQRRFLASYVDDICCAENADLRQADRAQFVRKLTAMHFDGPVAQAELRVARNLHGLGMFSKFVEHGDIAGRACLCVVFCAAGAAAVYDVMRHTTARAQT